MKIKYILEIFRQIIKLYHLVKFKKMIRLLRKNGVVVGAQELVKTPSGDYWQHADILDLDTPEKPKKKSLAQELYEAAGGPGWEECCLKDYWEKAATKALSLILDGKEEDIAKVLLKQTGTRCSHLFIAKQILTYLKEDRK